MIFEYLDVWQFGKIALDLGDDGPG